MTTATLFNELTPTQEIQTHGIPSMEVFSKLVDVPVSELTSWRLTRKKTYQALLFSASIWHTH